MKFEISYRIFQDKYNSYKISITNTKIREINLQNSTNDENGNLYAISYSPSYKSQKTKKNYFIRSWHCGDIFIRKYPVQENIKISQKRRVCYPELINSLGMRESKKKGEASGRDDKIMIIEKRLKSVYTCVCLCVCALFREKEREREKERTTRRDTPVWRAASRGQRHAEAEKPQVTSGCARAHTYRVFKRK